MVAVADIPAVITRADLIGTQKSELANSTTQSAIALAKSIVPPTLNIPTLNVEIPIAPSVPEDLSDEARDTYEDIRAALLQQLKDQFSQFFSQYFPIGSQLEQAMNWVSNALLNGGSGIKAAVEASIWDRDRSRLLAEAARQEEESASNWAARGFPMPPGMLTYDLARVRQDITSKIADVSRETAIKAWEAELENTRFAIEKAIQLRTTAISSASEYIKTLVLAPQLGAQVAQTLADARARLVSASTQLYSAQVQGAELPLRALIAQVDSSVKAADLNLKGQQASVELAVQAAIAAANSAGTQAAAALNAVHASVSWGLADQRDLTGTF